MSVQTSEPGFTLHKLKHDDYHVITGMREEYKTPLPDSKDGELVGHIVTTRDGQRGIVTGLALDSISGQPTEFARVNGRLYHVSTLTRIRCGRQTKTSKGRL